MYKKYFGKPKKMRFDTPDEYYKTLGFLAKSDGKTLITWEDNQNQGAWEHEVRIHCLKDLDMFPRPLSDKFTIGTGNALKRINCNEFIEDLLDNHSFVEGDTQNYFDIKATIPAQYQSVFDDGYNL